MAEPTRAATPAAGLPMWDMSIDLLRRDRDELIVRARAARE
jgi:hypothetical protein